MSSEELFSGSTSDSEPDCDTLSSQSSGCDSETYDEDLSAIPKKRTRAACDTSTSVEKQPRRERYYPNRGMAGFVFSKSPKTASSDRTNSRKSTAHFYGHSQRSTTKVPSKVASESRLPYSVQPIPTSVPRGQVSSPVRMVLPTEPTGDQPTPESDTGLCSEVKSALQDITSLLNTVVKRVERVETELQRQQSLTPASSSSDSTPARSKTYVPLVVRSEVRKVYRALLDEEEDFTGFDFGIGVNWRSSTNIEVMKKLMKEVQAINPQFQASQIRAAAYTYYRTLTQEDSLKRRGKHDERMKVRRRRERLLRKLQERHSTLKKSTLMEKEKIKWKKVITAEFMSSEESDPEDEDAIIVKPLPWRSERVVQFFRQLDEKGGERKTTQAKRQRKTRILSDDFSLRPKPTVNVPGWAWK